MKEQLLYVVIGTVGNAIKFGGIKASVSQREQLMNPSNWELAGTKSQIINTTTYYLFSYTLNFLQVELEVQNNTVVRINLVTDPFKEIKYESE